MKLKNLVKKLIIPTVGVCSMTPVMLGATQINTFASTNGISAAEAVAWVQSLEGQGIDYDGAYGNQCVDLIKAYYDYLGESPVRGNADTYAYNALPEGWERIQGAEPRPGDILVYTGGAYGHVAIYTGDNESYHQNWGGSYVQKVSGYDYAGMGYWGVIRPDFTDSPDYDYTSETYGDSVSYAADETFGYEYDGSYENTSYRKRPYDADFRPERRPEGERPSFNERR